MYLEEELHGCGQQLQLDLRVEAVSGMSRVAFHGWHVKGRICWGVLFRNPEPTACLCALTMLVSSGKGEQFKKGGVRWGEPFDNPELVARLPLRTPCWSRVCHSMTPAMACRSSPCWSPWGSKGGIFKGWRWGVPFDNPQLVARLLLRTACWPRVCHSTTRAMACRSSPCWSPQGRSPGRSPAARRRCRCAPRTRLQGHH